MKGLTALPSAIPWDSLSQPGHRFSPVSAGKPKTELCLVFLVMRRPFFMEKDFFKGVGNMAKQDKDAGGHT